MQICSVINWMLGEVESLAVFVFEPLHGFLFCRVVCVFSSSFCLVVEIIMPNSLFWTDMNDSTKALWQWRDRSSFFALFFVMESAIVESSKAF